MIVSALRFRNLDPAIPSFWIDYPIMWGPIEDRPCSRIEEVQRFVEGLPCDLEWDRDE